MPILIRITSYFGRDMVHPASSFPIINKLPSFTEPALTITSLAQSLLVLMSEGAARVIRRQCHNCCVLNGLVADFDLICNDGVGGIADRLNFADGEAAVAEGRACLLQRAVQVVRKRGSALGRGQRPCVHFVNF